MPGQQGPTEGRTGHLLSIFPVPQGMLQCCCVHCCVLFHSWCALYCRPLRSGPDMLVQYMRTTCDAVMAGHGRTSARSYGQCW